MLLLFFAFQLTLPAFSNGGAIPKENTCDGGGVSPALEWTGAAAAAKSFAIVLEDPDAPSGLFTHWLQWNIPASTTSLPAGFHGELGISGANDFGNPGYGAPCPPKGHGPHRYFFRVYALKTASLTLKKNANRAAFDLAIGGKVLGDAHYMGKYERK